MNTIYLNGQECHTSGSIPAAGSAAPDFKLTGKDLNDIRLSDYRGQRVVLNIFPSLDTPVCAASVRRFNTEAAALDNVTVICISMDLPFAQSRFCVANDIEDVVTASAFRAPEFARQYGVLIIDGPLAGLLTRAVIVVGTDGRIIYSAPVEEITGEPDYQGAISALG